MKNSIALSICVAAALFSTSSTFAAKGVARDAKPYEPPAVTVPDADPKGAEQARTDATTARADRKKAEDNLASTVAKLKEDFEKSPATAAASADLKSAQAAYDTIVKPLLASVHETPEYKNAFATKLDDESKISDLHKSSGNDAQISQLALDAMKQSSTATKLESDAIRNDPTAADAKKKLAAAGLTVGKLHTEFTASLKQNKDWQAARKALDDAIQKSQLAEANSQQESQKLAAALAAHNAAEARREAVDRSYQKPPASKKPDKSTENN